MKAVITFNPDRVAQWDIQSEGHVLAYMFKEALTGQDYARERGIKSIDLGNPLEPHIRAIAAAWQAMATDEPDGPLPDQFKGLYEAVTAAVKALSDQA